VTLVFLAWLGFVGISAPQAASTIAAPAVTVPAPHPTDTCPVCGMFVEKYRQWVATVVWKDGTAVHFDGAKDLFTYLLRLSTYVPKRSPQDIRTIAVTEFYDLHTVDARQSFYVIGSDVLGPMGQELVPLARRADAEEFSRDHHGVRILRFSEVTLETVRRLDASRN
jgi:copper chaperone NosL